VVAGIAPTRGTYLSLLSIIITHVVAKTYLLEGIEGEGTVGNLFRSFSHDETPFKKDV